VLVERRGGEKLKSKSMTDILYKYRSLEDFKKFVDILVNKRLYAANYKDLNDPMEGQYLYSRKDLSHFTPNIIYSEKNRLKICSLSSQHNNQLLWTHYANGDKGVAIGVRIDDERYDVVNVQYDGISTVINYDNDTPKKILSHKLEIWSYEEEVRVFVEETSFVEIKIEEIIIGSRVAHNELEWIKNIILKIDSNINVIKRNQVF
jgi:hypothetical protein